MPARSTFNDSLSFDPYSMAFVGGQQQEQYTDFSPISLFNPVEDFQNTDFPSDSATSPTSPLTPVMNPDFDFSMGDNWTLAWDKLENPAAAVLPKIETPDEPVLASIPAHEPGLLSPAVNPLDLTTAATTKCYPSRTLKRKSSSSSDEGDADSYLSPTTTTATRPSAAATTPAATQKQQSPKKSAHNMIEKRYRTNLNDKIAALRDSVPALRVVVHRLECADDETTSSSSSEHSGNSSSRRRRVQMRRRSAEARGREGEDDDDGVEDLGGLQPAHKLNKATILSKATEYIAHLERRNRALHREIAALRGVVAGLEGIVLGSNSRAAVGVGAMGFGAPPQVQMQRGGGVGVGSGGWVR